MKGMSHFESEACPCHDCTVTRRLFAEMLEKLPNGFRPTSVVFELARCYGIFLGGATDPAGNIDRLLGDVAVTIGRHARIAYAKIAVIEEQGND